MRTKRNPTEVVARYRAAAIRRFGLTQKQAEECIYTPENDPGEWAPRALAIINFETGLLPGCSYWDPHGLDNCIRLGNEAGIGFIEWINPAVGAVYE